MSGLLRFCPECNNLLYPTEDKQAKELHFACRQCEYVEASGGTDEDCCVFRHDVTYVAREAIIVNPAVTKDPTLGRDYSYECDYCDSKEAVFYQLPEKQSSDAMTLVFVCCSCGAWREEGKARD